MIRKARLDEINQISALFEDSVREICGAHPEYVDGATELWIQHRRPEIPKWLANPEAYFIVSESSDSRLDGIGLFLPPNEIQLLYVHPSRVGGGIGKKLLDELEREAKRRGASHLQFSISLNAENFYLRNGYTRVSRELALEKIPYIVVKKDLS